jgi:hypothetical protein
MWGRKRVINNNKYRYSSTSNVKGYLGLLLHCTIVRSLVCFCTNAVLLLFQIFEFDRHVCK